METKRRREHRLANAQRTPHAPPHARPHARQHTRTPVADSLATPRAAARYILFLVTIFNTLRIFFKADATRTWGNLITRGPPQGAASHLFLNYIYGTFESSPLPHFSLDKFFLYLLTCVFPIIFTFGIKKKEACDRSVWRLIISTCNTSVMGLGILPQIHSL